LRRRLSPRACANVLAKGFDLGLAERIEAGHAAADERAIVNH
jgi:hypothetical protein